MPYLVVATTLSQHSGLLIFTDGLSPHPPSFSSPACCCSLPGLGNGSPTGGAIGRAHQVLGTAVFGMTCAQVTG